MESIIYKVVSRELWEESQSNATFPGAAIDLADGFIHFSTRDQVMETVAKHFAGQSDLIIVAVDTSRLDDLRWEPSRGGELFPHLYGDLPMEAVVWVKNLALGHAGVHIFPDM